MYLINALMEFATTVPGFSGMKFSQVLCKSLPVYHGLGRSLRSSFGLSGFAGSYRSLSVIASLCRSCRSCNVSATLWWSLQFSQGLSWSFQVPYGLCRSLRDSAGLSGSTFRAAVGQSGSLQGLYGLSGFSLQGLSGFSGSLHVSLQASQCFCKTVIISAGLCMSLRGIADGGCRSLLLWSPNHQTWGSVPAERVRARAKARVANLWLGQGKGIG